MKPTPADLATVRKWVTDGEVRPAPSSVYTIKLKSGLTWPELTELAKPTKPSTNKTKK